MQQYRLAAASLPLLSALPRLRCGSTCPRATGGIRTVGTLPVTSFIGWYRAGVDVQAHLPVLSTFLGHSSPEATYWYLQAIPELLGLAAERLEPDGHRPHDNHPCDEGPGRQQ